MRSRKSGLHVSSASRKASNRPRATAMPALRATLTPRLGCESHRMRGSVWSFSQANVPSSEPSSTVMSSQSTKVCAITLATLAGK